MTRRTLMPRVRRDGRQRHDDLVSVARLDPSTEAELRTAPFTYTERMSSRVKEHAPPIRGGLHRRESRTQGLRLDGRGPQLIHREIQVNPAAGALVPRSCHKVPTATSVGAVGAGLFPECLSAP